jgi:hypothetical protein
MFVEKAGRPHKTASSELKGCPEIGSETTLTAHLREKK